MLNKTPRPRMSDHVTPEIFAHCSARNLLQLAEPFVQQFERLQTNNCRPGMGLCSFVKAAFVDEGLLSADEELPISLSTTLANIERLDAAIAENLATEGSQQPRSLFGARPINARNPLVG